MPPVKLPDHDQSLEYASVKAWEAGIAEMDHKRPIVFAPRAEIHSLELAYASGAERPLVTILLGVAVLAVSVSPLLFLLGVLYFGGHMHLKLLSILAFAPLGLWLLRFAMKKRYILIVHTSKGKRKAVFQGPVDLNHARGFMSEISSRYGYTVIVSEPLQSAGDLARLAD
jgi:hypothetical protein